MTSTQHQIMRLGPRYLETPGARVLGPWEAAQHRTDPPLPHSKAGVSRVASGLNPAPSSAAYSASPPARSPGTGENRTGCVGLSGRSSSALTQYITLV